MTIAMRFMTVVVLALATACTPTNRINPLSEAVASSLTLSEVTVNSNAAAFENERARDFAGRVSADVEAAIKRRFDDRLNAGGLIMRVELSRLNVANSATSAFGRDQSVLQGNVQIIDPTTNTVMAAYNIDARAGNASETTTGALISAAVQSSDRFYRQLIARFADQTEERVLE